MSKSSSPTKPIRRVPRWHIPALPETLRYVGTPSGLAGLIADLYTLGLIDGAMLIPLVADDVAKLIFKEVLPELESLTGATIGGCRPHIA